MRAIWLAGVFTIAATGDLGALAEGAGHEELRRFAWFQTHRATIIRGGRPVIVDVTPRTPGRLRQTNSTNRCCHLRSPSRTPC